MSLNSTSLSLWNSCSLRTSFNFAFKSLTLFVNVCKWFKSADSSCLTAPIAISKWILKVGLPLYQLTFELLVDKQTVWSPAKWLVKVNDPIEGPLLLTTGCFSSVSSTWIRTPRLLAVTHSLLSWSYSSALYLPFLFISKDLARMVMNTDH